MKLSPLFLISLDLIPSLISAAVVPDVFSRNATLDNRGGEVNYLCNCFRTNFETGEAGYIAS